MKLHGFNLSAAAVILLGGAMVSCSDDDKSGFDDSGSNITLGSHRAFILNEGTFNMNNAGIAYFDTKNPDLFYSNIFLTQNGFNLGDSAVDMIEYRDNMYVAVYGSNYLARLNAAAVEIDRVSFVADPDLQGGIRHIDADDGYIYASFYGGYIAKIDCNTLEIKAKIKTSGQNLEDIAIEDDKLYVANSYEIVPDPSTGYNTYNYFNEILVLDLKTLQLLSPVTVASNPNRVIEADDKIFVISNDYSQESYVLQMIEPDKGNKVTVLGWATDMAAGNGKLYLVDSRTDYMAIPFATTNRFYTYDLKRGTVSPASFMNGEPAELESASVYSMAVDDETGDIYVNTTFYTYSDGDCYRFDRSGAFVEKFGCGGQNPRAMVFLDR